MWLEVRQLLTSKHLSGLEQPNSAHNLKKQYCSRCPTTPTTSISIHPLQKLLLIKLPEYYYKKTRNTFEKVEQEVTVSGHLTCEVITLKQNNIYIYMYKAFGLRNAARYFPDIKQNNHTQNCLQCSGT